VKVVVIIGTAGPFPRLVNAMAAWQAAHEDAEVWVQHGHGALPSGLAGSPFVTRTALLRRVGEADVVVCHAGSGTIGDVMGAGHVPVVVPRVARLHEHVNDHQLEIAAAMGPRVVMVTDVAKLDAALVEAAGRRGEARDPEASARAQGLVSAMRDELRAVEAQRGARRTGLVWRVMRALTGPVPRRRHRWSDEAS
jgi:UDP-N-acetylglucosamine transferase subunit ALG13